MDAITAYQLTSMMEGVVRSRGTAAGTVNLDRCRSAGKTGTTNEARDVWFVGFTSNIVAGCYIGYDRPSPLGKGAGGGSTCGPVFNEFMQTAIQKYGGGEFRVPEGGQFINIDRFSGARLSEEATGDHVVAEFFREGEEPLFGVTFDGGFAMGSNFDLIAPGEDAVKQVTTSTGGIAVGWTQGDDWDIILWWAVLTYSLEPVAGHSGLSAQGQFCKTLERFRTDRPHMRADIQNMVNEINKSLELLRQRMGWETVKHRLEEFNARVEDPDLWTDPENAQKLMRERQSLIDAVEGHDNMQTELNDSIELIELGEMEDDQDVIKDAESAIEVLVKTAAAKELEALLNGEADSNDTFLEVHSGAGGTESCDWASMLARMYVRWAEKTGYSVEMQSETPGEEAGIKSVTYKISGHNAYGWLKSESGVHRLVRISPFDSAAKRHTSFCSVWVYPVVDDNIDIEVNPADIRIDTYRSSGAGGQHVNTTDSAVRITHHPTGIVVTSSEKSQHQNRDIAMKALKSRLYQLELDRRNSAINEAHENKGDAGWGNQIRSYVLHPYQMVKDLRTGHETSDSKGVLDGDLDAFMAATLAMDLSGKSRAEATAAD
jgi:peptide chain release factor 2